MLEDLFFFFSKKNKVLEVSPVFLLQFLLPPVVSGLFQPRRGVAGRLQGRLYPWVRCQTLTKAAVLLDAGLQGVCL